MQSHSLKVKKDVQPISGPLLISTTMAIGGKTLKVLRNTQGPCNILLYRVTVSDPSKSRCSWCVMSIVKAIAIAVSGTSGRSPKGAWSDVEWLVTSADAILGSSAPRFWDLFSQSLWGCYQTLKQNKRTQRCLSLRESQPWDCPVEGVSWLL